MKQGRFYNAVLSEGRMSSGSGGGRGHNKINLWRRKVTHFYRSRRHKINSFNDFVCFW